MRGCREWMEGRRWRRVRSRGEVVGFIDIAIRRSVSGLKRSFAERTQILKSEIIVKIWRI